MGSLFGLEGAAAGEEVDEVGEDDGSDGGDEDAEDEAVLAGGPARTARVLG